MVAHTHTKMFLKLERKRILDEVDGSAILEHLPPKPKSMPMTLPYITRNDQTANRVFRKYMPEASIRISTSTSYEDVFTMTIYSYDIEQKNDIIVAAYKSTIALMANNPAFMVVVKTRVMIGDRETYDAAEEIKEERALTDILLHESKYSPRNYTIPFTVEYCWGPDATGCRNSLPYRELQINMKDIFDIKLEWIVKIIILLLSRPIGSHVRLLSSDLIRMVFERCERPNNLYARSKRFILENYPGDSQSSNEV